MRTPFAGTPLPRNRDVCGRFCYAETSEMVLLGVRGDGERTTSELYLCSAADRGRCGGARPGRSEDGRALGTNRPPTAPAPPAGPKPAGPHAPDLPYAGPSRWGGTPPLPAGPARWGQTPTNARPALAV